MGSMSIQKDRDHKAAAETIVYSEEELRSIKYALLKKIDLKQAS